ncbi:DUF6134 family protein [Anditalea andensis]|uniref:DUF6134 family protein n=1 Tax=Anditalea andensis TaxID=1048983 RepID=UPI0013DEC9AC|nr:DUF6134 family protein [Anditalea andensis]
MKFSISVAGITIGEMKAVKTSGTDQDRYQLESKVDFWFFGKIKALVSTDAYYNESQFLQSTMHTRTNKGEFLSTIKWDRDRYAIEAESYKYEHKDEIIGPMDYSGIKLFFQEPREVSNLLNEHYGKVALVNKGMKGYYEVNVAGNINKYYYENGQLIKAVMEHPIKNYVVKRIL